MLKWLKTILGDTYVIQGNYLLLGGTAEALSGVAQTIYDTIKDVRYTPCKVAIWQQGTLRAGNIVTVKDNAGAALTCYIMQRTVSGSSETLECTGNSSRECTTAVNRQSYKDIRGKMLEISTTVEGLTVRASDLEDNYSELSQTVDGLSSVVSSSVLANVLLYPDFSNYSDDTWYTISTDLGCLRQ